MPTKRVEGMSSRRLLKGSPCIVCEKIGVLARGLCPACYNRDLRAYHKVNGGTARTRRRCLSCEKMFTSRHRPGEVQKINYCPRCLHNSLERNRNMVDSGSPDPKLWLSRPAYKRLQKLNPTPDPTGSTLPKRENAVRDLLKWAFQKES